MFYFLMFINGCVFTVLLIIYGIKKLIEYIKFEKDFNNLYNSISSENYDEDYDYDLEYDDVEDYYYEGDDDYGN